MSLPSPADSPPFHPSDPSSSPTTISSRKRQRSTSGDSAAEGESVKRGSPRPVQIDSLSLSDPLQNMDEDEGMDAYMQEQGHLEPSQSTADKLSLITTLKRQTMALGQKWYLVDRTWCRNWRASLGEIDPKSTTTPVAEDQLGPPQTSALLDQYGNLKTGLVEEVDVEYLPEEAWKLLVSWYGAPAIPLPRSTITRGTYVTLELHPPQFKVHLVSNDNVPPPPSQLSGTSTPASLTLSAHTPVTEFAKALALRVQPSSTDLSEFRIWKVPESLSSNELEIHPSQLMSRNSLLDHGSPLTLEAALIESGDVFAVEYQDPETKKWPVDLERAKISTASTATTEPAPLFNSREGFFDRMSSDSATSSLPSTSKNVTQEKKEIDRKLSVVAKKEKRIEPGTLGLGNMGNTCFMNSALQCLAHQQELTEYFLTGVYASELNPDNPLGMGGAIAESFGALLAKIWWGSELAETFGAGEENDKKSEESKGIMGTRSKVSKFFGRSPPASSYGGYSGYGSSWNPGATSYSPREFKSQLAKFAPQFSGYQQHDTQELVAFLLDGLHEDLNRVLKKPYVEKGDWMGARPPVSVPFRERRTLEADGEDEDKEEYKHAKEEYEKAEREKYLREHDWDKELEEDKEMLRFARESWEGYKRRNDSVIVDLFQGQYRSTLICPECQKVSITFDPFMYLTLPLPIQKKWRHTIFYIPWDIERPHVRVPVEIGRDASFKDLRALLGRWMGARPENLLTLEIFNNRFYKNLDDSLPCGDMADADLIVCFELPCNSQQSRSWVRSDHPDDPWVLPMLLCDAPAANVHNTFAGQRTYGGGMNNYKHTNQLFGYPTIAVITPEQAKSVEGIYGAVVERLARWTKQRRHLWTWEAPDGFASGSSGLAPAEGEDNGVETVRLDAMEDEPGLETVTEIGEDGHVVNVTQPVQNPARQQPTPLEEGDIVDEKAAVLAEVDGDLSGSMSAPVTAAPICLGPKRDIFHLKLGLNHKEYGTHQVYGTTATRFDSLQRRVEEAEKERDGKDDSNDTGALLKEGDAIYCEFDENMKAFYFGEDRNTNFSTKFEHALWEEWEEFTHPEYTESVNAASTRRTRGIALSDCLDEFTKEEQLGADDLWYCPQCKKHQQATKKFDLWSVPDVLVVHLKRFSNSRMLRDKIDAFVDFPVEGLDLGDRIGERKVLERLQVRGVDVNSEELLGGGGGEGTHTAKNSEPLMYDLFAVDEHIGGLGGGHYRAYAQNHVNGKWYHFDDSFVTISNANDAVNQNAYLLFYRRRTGGALGGKSHELVDRAMQNPPSGRDGSSSSSSNAGGLEGDSSMHTDIQLPTPPNEHNFGESDLPSYLHNSPSSSRTFDRWTDSNVHNGASGSSLMDVGIPSPPLEDDPPDFEHALSTQLISEPVRYDDDETDELIDRNSPGLGYVLPEPSRMRMTGVEDSPSSSVDVEPDLEDLDASSYYEGEWSEKVRGRQASGSPTWSGSVLSNSHISSRDASPSSSSNVSEAFVDAAEMT